MLYAGRGEASLVCELFWFGLVWFSLMVYQPLYVI